MNNKTASFVKEWFGEWNGRAFEDNEYEVVKLKSQNDFAMIIEAISSAQLKLGISHEKHATRIVVVVPDNYKYSQKVDLVNFCQNVTDVSRLRVIPASRAMMFSVDFYATNKEGEDALFFSYLSGCLTIAWCEIGDGVCELKGTWELNIKDTDKQIIEKIEKALKSGIKFWNNLANREFNLLPDHIDACYFSKNTPFLTELRDHFQSKSIMKLRTLNDDSYDFGGMMQLKIMDGHVKNRLLLDATPYTIKTTELSIDKNTTFPTSCHETLTTVTDKQKSIEVPLWVQIPFSDNYELIDVLESKIGSDKPAKEEKIQIFINIDADGLINMDASTEQKKKIHLYDIKDEGWRKYV